MSYIESLNRFAQSPVGLDIGRSKFNMPTKVKTTFTSGKLIPLMWKEVLPGDTFKCSMDAVVRSITPVVPVMDDSFLDVYYFFVPNRLACLHPNDWAAVCGENFSGPWAQSTEATLETTGNYGTLNNVAGSPNGIESMSLANYLGLPVLTSTEISSLTGKVNYLPFVAYTKIWNEWFRDENIENPVSFNNIGTCNFLREVNKLHDYFTSCLPSPQKSASITLPLGTLAPVLTSASQVVSGAQASLHYRKTDGTALPSNGWNVTANTSGTVGVAALSSGVGTTYVYPDNLYADLANATAASVNAVRLAFALQRFAEKQGLGGSRYRETLKSFYGVTIPDYTVQVPEYLGGKRIPLNISQVLQTSSTDSVSPLGSTGAFSNTAMSDNGFVKSFNEYGILMCVACVRTMQSYSQGIPKEFVRNRRFDYYWPVFANLGETPVYKYELYAKGEFAPNTTASVFGYQEAWAEYRYSPIRITGNFAPWANDTSLTAWTYTNNFNSAPVLNGNFIHQPSSQIADTLVVSSSSYQFIGDFQFNITAVRPMPLYSIPGLIDHH